MRDVGPLLASGRDADIFAFGPGIVVRRSRLGRSMEREAKIMHTSLRTVFRHRESKTSAPAARSS
jgi:hypothetical protein